MFPFKKVSKTSQSEMRDIAARICRDYLHGAWKTIAAEEIQLRRISGGLSNFLYYVSLPDSHLAVATSNETTGSPKLCHKKPRKDSDNNNTIRLQFGEELHHQVKEPKEVLLRIYGQAHGEHALEAMLTESVVFALLSERRLGPKLHGIFPGGRIEQYIPARPLKTGELADRRISMKISEKMAEIHSLDIPVSKEPDWIWKTTHRWLISVENVFNNNSTSIAVPDTAFRLEIKDRLRRIDFKKEVQWLREQLKDEVDFLVVFSHNDLQEGNILMRDERRGRNKSNNFADTSEITLSDFEESSNRLDNILITQNRNGNAGESTQKDSREKGVIASRKRTKSSGEGIEEEDDDGEEAPRGTEVAELIGRREMPGTEDDIIVEDDSVIEEEPELMIIDFEYCSYNYRGFDLANHFLEWTFDYTNKDYPFFFHKKHQYPNEEQKKAFLDMYLKTSHRIKGESDDVVDDQAEKSLLEREIDFFKCASHLFWSLWAIVYCDQEIEFGYWEYADCRLKEYFGAKENYLMRYKRIGGGQQQTGKGV